MIKQTLTSIPYEEALEQSKKYFNGSEMEASVFLDKYALKDNEGNLYESTPDDMHQRLANELHRIEINYPNPRSYEEILTSLKGFKYLIPQGSPMAAMGNPFQVMSLSNCFVIHNDADSYGGIMRIDEQLAHLMKRRAGVGTDISHLRPESSPVQNAARTSTGAVSFMERYSETTREVAQSGRRGALMLTISGLHPDVEKFVDIKMDETKVTGANISVRQSDEFLEAVDRGDTEFTLRFPVDKPADEAEFTKIVNPQEIWEKIVHNAWQRAEPGLFFWDRVIKESIPDCYADLGYRSISTNPCGEIVLPDADSCRLLATNLYSFVKNPFTDEAYFDWDLFEEQIILGQRMMDNIVDLEIEAVDKIISKIKSDPESEDIKWIELNMWERIRDKATRGRRTGFGITAMGDMLAAMGFVYGTEDATDFAEKVMRFKKLKEYESSIILAEERGAFPIWDHEREKDNPFLNRIKQEDPELYYRMSLSGRRNIALSTIAPTGTVSLMAQTSSGIENAFMIVYYRSKKVNPNDEDVRVDYVDNVGDSWQEFPVFHHKFRDYLKIKGFSEEEILEFTKEEIQDLIKESPYYGATAADVNWPKKVEMQGRIQKHIDHSISVTVNLPEDIPVEKVQEVYMTAWKSGCKGITIYRDKSRGGVLNTKSKKEEQSKGVIKYDATKRPEDLTCHIHKARAEGGTWRVLVGLLDGDPYEVFAFKTSDTRISQTQGILRKKGKGNYDLCDEDGSIIIEDITSKFESEEEEALTRMISSSLRHGMDSSFIVEQLSKSPGTVVSFNKALSRILSKYAENVRSEVEKLDGCEREDCYIVKEEGCEKCYTCGKSKCT